MYEVVLFANVMLWLGITFTYIKLPAASLFHPVSYYLFFHGFIFTLRPIVVHIQGYTDLYKLYDFMPSGEDKTTVILASMLGLVCFVAAGLKVGQGRFEFKQDRFNELEREQLIKPFLFVAALLAPLGLVSVLSDWSSRASDLSTMVLDASTGHSINTVSTGYFADLQLLLAPLAVMTVWIFRFRWWTFLPLATFIVLRSGTGGRWPILMACASVALLFLYQNRTKLPKLRSLVLIASALWLFQVIGIDRGASVRAAFIDDNSLAQIYTGRQDLGFLEGMDFANMEFFEYIVYAVPQRTGTYGYFLDNLQVLTEPIPRVLWPGKPVGPPIQLFSLFDYGYPIGMTYSLPGEGWMQLGFVGVALWCGLFGWFYGWIYAKFQRSRHSNLAVLGFLLFLPMSLQVFRDGLLLTLVKSHAWFLLPILLTFAFARLSAVPLADDLRLRAYRRLAKRSPDVAPKIRARQGGRVRRPRMPAE